MTNKKKYQFLLMLISLVAIGNLTSVFAQSQVFPLDTIMIGDGTEHSYFQMVATNSVTLNSSNGAVIIKKNGLGLIEAGKSIVIKPTDDNSLGFLAATGSSCLMRITTQKTGLDILSLNQKVVSKDIATQLCQFEIYPNPTSSFLNFQTQLKHADIEIYDISGKLVLKIIDVDLQKPLDVSLIGKGTFLLRANNSGNSFKKLLVVQ